MKFGAWSIAFLGAWAALGSAHAETYQLQLRVDARAVTCAEQKPEVEKIVLAAGEALGKELKNVRVSCYQELTAPLVAGGAHRAYLFSVRYDVVGFPKVYTAHWGTDASYRGPGVSRGIFATIEACLDARAAEVEAFELRTGLEAGFVGCSPQESGTGFVLSVTGFGIPNERLEVQSLSANFWEDPQLDADETRWIKGYLYSKGAKLRSIQNGTLVYFAPSEIALQMRHFGHWYDESHCRRQLTDAAMILAGTPFYFSCKTTQLTNGVNWVQLRAIYAGNRLYSSDFGHMSPQYDSFEACRTFLPEIVEEAKALDPRSFLGALCIPAGTSSPRWAIEKWSHL